MEINWTVLTYMVIGLFALNGFFRGWWKEAVTTVFLVLLVFLLQQPELAESFINLLNELLRTVWQALPDTLVPTIRDLLETLLGVRTSAVGIQANPGNPGTWLMVLILFMVVATLLGRTGLTNQNYPPNPVGSLLGGLVGIFNGFLVTNLVREYLDGRALPGEISRPATEITMAGGSSFGVASRGISIQAVELPRFTILDSFIPWIITVAGILILIAILNTRFSRDGLNVRPNKVPPGYKGGKK